MLEIGVPNCHFFFDSFPDSYPWNEIHTRIWDSESGLRLLE